VSKPAISLVSGRDYPRDWNQFLDWFADEEACLSYLKQLRWPEGFVCPRCAGSGEPYRSSRGRLMCRACRYQCTVTAATLFDKTRTPLRTWLAAAWYLTNQKFGVSALGLQRVLGLGSYQTSWAMLHRLRRAMVRPDRERLNGKVEVDETYVGIRDPNKPFQRARRQSRTFRTLVAIAIEVQEPKGFGRIRLRRVPAASETYLLPFVREAVVPGARVNTDGSPAYRSLSQHGYVHQQRVQLRSEDPAHVSMPGVHRVASLLKRWLLGTHQGAVQPSHLDYYLDEFTFRFNRRTARSRGLLFYRLLEQAVATQPVTYEDIATHNL
jgi:transposase-like protein